MRDDQILADLADEMADLAALVGDHPVTSTAQLRRPDGAFATA